MQTSMHPVAIRGGALLIAALVAGCPRAEPTRPRARPVARPRVPTRWRSVSAGGDHTCAVARDRTLWCWGANDQGQLGDGTHTDRDRPTPVRGLRAVVSVSATQRRTYAVTTAGELWGWGAGQRSLTTPRRLPIPEPVVAYRVGARSCALTRKGNLWCWKHAWWARPADASAAPHRPTGLPSLVGFDVGSNHVCGLDQTHRLWCWGGNDQGQMGDGTRASRVQPRRVARLPAVSKVVCAGDATCVITRDARVWCWGAVGPPPPRKSDEPGAEPSVGEPGEPDGLQPTPVLRPRLLDGLQHVVSLVLGAPHSWALTRQGRLLRWASAGVHGAKRECVRSTGNAVALRLGADHRCVLDRQGRVRCWGANERGQLGVGATRRQRLPLLVTGLPAVKHLAVGRRHACGLDHAGQLWCWGDDTAGQLGLGSLARWRATRKIPPSLRGVRAGTAANWHVCAVKRGGDVWCWGIRPYSEQHRTGQAHDLRPRQIPGLRDVTDVSALYVDTCALRQDGSVWCWGDNNGFVLLRPRARLRDPGPQPVSNLGRATRVSVGFDHACAIGRDRRVWCWDERCRPVMRGGIWEGKVHPLDRPPRPFEAFHEGVALASGAFHSCAVARDTTVWCWGRNKLGQLGDGSQENLARPVQVQGLRGVRRLAAGFRHTCAARRDGSVWCWGDNRRGQLGAAAPKLSTAPRRVSGLPRVTAVYAGADHTCARTARGRLWCWGQAIGYRSDRRQVRAPAPVAGLGAVRSAWIGHCFACALGQDDTVRCWGRNDQGQLGRGPPPYRSRPVRLPGDR